MNRIYSYIVNLMEELNDFEAAAHPNTDPAKLQQLALHDDEGIKQRVAQNPNTPPHVLSSLFKNGFHNEVQENPALPLIHLEDPNFMNQLIGDEPAITDVHYNYKHPQLLAHAANHPEDYVRSFAAKNVNTPENVLSKLIFDPEEYPEVQANAVSNKNMPIEKLASLISHPSTKVRTSLAKRDDLPEEFIKKLVKDPQEDVRKALFHDKDVDVRTLHSFKNDSSPKVREMVAWHKNADKDLLHHLAQDDNKEVRARVATRKDLHPETVKLLKNDPDVYVRDWVKTSQINKKFNRKLGK